MHGYRHIIVLLSFVGLSAACGPPNPGLQAFMAENNARNGMAAPAAGGPQSASEVCDLITMSETRLECVQGSATRSYSAAELQTCAGMMMNEQKRDCMLTSGVGAEVAEVSPPPPPPPVEVAPAGYTGPTQPLNLQNHNAVAITRVVWRYVDEVRFHEAPLRRPLAHKTTVDLAIGIGKKLDFCYEFENGNRVFVTNWDPNGLGAKAWYLVPATESRAQPGRCDDTL